VPAEVGGDDDHYIRVPVLNDTGSSNQTLYSSDLERLNFDVHTFKQRGGEYGNVTSSTSNGIVTRQFIKIQMRVVDTQGLALTEWFLTKVALRAEHPGRKLRLSGREVRQHLFFATPAGNSALFVAKDKAALMSIL
jgi:hypothetical protein